jgi:hypothetical protein
MCFSEPIRVRGPSKLWRIGKEANREGNLLQRDVISRKFSVPNAERIFLIRRP